MTATTDTEGVPDPNPLPEQLRWRANGFTIGVAVAVAIGGIIRVVNVLSWRPTCREDIVAVVEAGGNHGFDPTLGGDCFGIWGDSAYYYIQGRLLARGHWFVDSYGWFASSGTSFTPSAGNPPLYTMFLALLSKLGFTSGTQLRLATSIVALSGVVALAVLVRKLAGPRAGVIVAVLAAVYPMLWINDAMLLSEGLYVPLVVVVLLAAYRFWEEQSLKSAALLGVALAFAALTRGEALLLFGFTVVPLLFALRKRGLRDVIRFAMVIWSVGALLVSPWIIFNLTRFEEPVLMTASTGAVLSSASCDTTYYGEYIGYFGNCFDLYVQEGRLIGKIPTCDQAAVDAAKFDPSGEAAGRCWPDHTYDESQRDKISRDLAFEYMRTHLDRLPVVMVARVGRMWDLYVPQIGQDPEPLGQNVRLNWQVEGRGKRSSEAGVLMYYALLPLACLGAIAFRRRRIPLSPLVAMAVVITVTSALTFGVTRYRVPVDVMVVVLAAVGIDAALRRWRPAGSP